MKSILLSITATLLCATSAVAAGPVRWHNESADTIRVQKILTATASAAADSIVINIARCFEGTPYMASTLEFSPEMTTVNLDGLDCTTYVETVMALAVTAGEQRLSWHDFVYNLEKMRYRRGTPDGYSSRLHYFSDWIMENTQRGIVREVTDRLPGAEFKVKTLDFMTRNRDRYPALADDTEFQRMKSAESAYRSHRYPMIASSRVSKATLGALRPGDIVAFVSKTDGLDISHIGFIDIRGGKVRLLHASSRGGKIMLDPLPLSDYLRRNRSIAGIRIIRQAAR